MEAVVRDRLRSRAEDLQGLLENKVHYAVCAYSRRTPMGLGSPYERCGTFPTVAPVSSKEVCS